AGLLRPAEDRGPAGIPRRAGRQARRRGGRPSERRGRQRRRRGARRQPAHRADHSRLAPGRRGTEHADAGRHRAGPPGARRPEPADRRPAPQSAARPAVQPSAEPAAEHGLRGPAAATGGHRPAPAATQFGVRPPPATARPPRDRQEGRIPVNPALRRSGVIALILLGALLLRITWVQFFDHAEYDQANGRTILAEYETPRGLILAGDVVIAQSLESDPGSTYDYYRDYPEGDYFGNITGFKSIQRGASAMESAQNDVLNGSSSLFFLDELGNTLTGKETLGGNVSLTLDAELQKAAYEALDATGSHGGAVVLEPQTGRILAQASYPGWNPTSVSSNDPATANAAWAELIDAPSNPGSDRTRSEWYPPGSTFKTIVAAAFIEGGHGDADTMVPAGNGYTAPDTDHEITNSSDQCPQSEMTLKEAFKLSCNTTFARLCVETLSEEDILETAAAFGFEEEFTTPLDSLASTTGEISEKAFRAQACIGQQEVRETVLQNAVIAAAVANGG